MTAIALTKFSINNDDMDHINEKIIETFSSELVKLTSENILKIKNLFNDTTQSRKELMQEINSAILFEKDDTNINPKFYAKIITKIVEIAINRFGSNNITFESYKPDFTPASEVRIVNVALKNAGQILNFDVDYQSNSTISIQY